ncbi:hypothetical protein OIU76_026036 [Salix suchowensis]|uniref:Uncharacterized protein n=1 Tax=Salix suchowensis TaxID=1278906 RepID=A0ABQ9AFG3_9ROSI|nr:hypothetical protein OIU77_009580 [Salix suchowensis]KAJ6376997.1 hypothetical protein OIU76_026036 [Salix suchowensis]
MGYIPRNLNKDDIVLAGVSRTGKTSLSTYLPQEGYKVPNVRTVNDVKLQKSLFNAVVLTNDKESEAKSVGFSNYSEMDCVREELEFALRIFAQNPFWPVIGNVVQFSNVQLIGSFKDMLVIDS